MTALLLKAIIGTAVAIALLEWIYTKLGYDRTEFIAFGLLIGLSVAALKPSKH